MCFERFDYILFILTQKSNGTTYNVMPLDTDILFRIYLLVEFLYTVLDVNLTYRSVLHTATADVVD